MWEIGRRELPTVALIKLSALVSGLHHTPSMRQPELWPDKGRAAMRRHAASCLHKARVAKKKLEAVQQKYQDCLKTVAVISHLQNNIPQGKEAKKDQVWLELLQAQTSKKLKKCSPAAQFKLKLNLQVLEMQAEEVGKI